jgi:hypothetical protein
MPSEPYIAPQELHDNLFDNWGHSWKCTGQWTSIGIGVWRSGNASSITQYLYRCSKCLMTARFEIDYIPNPIKIKFILDRSLSCDEEILRTVLE